MAYLDEWSKQIDEYIDIQDPYKIQHLSIEVGYPVIFFIMDSERLAGYIKPSGEFELAILINFKKIKKEGKKLQERIDASGCLSDFIEIKSDKSSMYIKKTGNDKTCILRTVKRIIEELFLCPQSVTTKLIKLTGWITLEE